MMITREFDFSTEDKTWGDKPVPPALKSLHGKRHSVSMLSVLLATAVWTRPPAMYGFSLSDCWAWMRYLPALTPWRALKLREEWTALDPHHKAVLSGDFGVGFATCILADLLGFTEYADTLRAVHILFPKKFKLARSARRGPAKSPDYIAIDSAGKFSVLECKGGQSTRPALLKAISNGVAQKKNVETIGGTQLEHSLVAGVYVPQWGSRKPALFAVQDPDWPELRNALNETGPDALSRVVQRVSAAKQLALLDLATTANTFVGAVGAAESLEAALQVDLSRENRGVIETSDGLRAERVYRWVEPIEVDDGTRAIGLRFTALLPEWVRAELVRARHPDIAAEVMRSRRERVRLSPTQWTDGAVAGMQGSVGTEFRLELLLE